MHENQWDELIEKALNDMPLLVEDFIHEFNEVGLYGESVIPESELRSTAHEVLTLILKATTSNQTQPGLKDHAEQFGNRRARQGIDLPQLVDAIHLDFKVIWNYLKMASGEESLPVLIEHVEKLNYVVTEYAFYVRTSFQREEARSAQDFRIANSRYLDRLFSSDSLGERGLNEISHILEVDASIECEVVVFHPSVADEVHSRLEPATASGKVFCQSFGTSYVAFWRTKSTEIERQIEKLAHFPGIRFETVVGLAEVRGAVRSSPQLFDSFGRPTGIEPIKNAMWAVARDALTSVYGRQIHEISDYLHELRRTKDPILDTVRAYLETGSIKQTAQLSFCHRNTVINRIKQFSSRSGLDITVPNQASLVVVALSSPS